MIVVYRNIPDMRENTILGCAVKIETPALLLVPMLLLRVNTTYHANHTADMHSEFAQYHLQAGYKQ